jgi:hypothetical protein
VSWVAFDDGLRLATTVDVPCQPGRHNERLGQRRRRWLIAACCRQQVDNPGLDRLAAP